MMVPFRTWWIARNSREKRMLGVMLMLLAIVVGWLGIFRPVTHGLTDAETAHRAAVDRAARINASVTLLRDARPRETPPAGPLDQVIAQSAAEAGFTLGGNTPTGADSVSITIGSARAPALLAWLGSLEARGLTIDAATIQPGANRTIAARITLRRSGR
ncbi:MAG TPA: type II secretion system protein GspM [Sphingomonas sp.]|nr:type II secretion system protein GspM [Sphingomonas sp.]